MPSTFSPNLRIELIASGEQTNQWGNTTNTNLGTVIEEAISGLTTVDVTAGNVTLTAYNGIADQARKMIINVTGTPGVARTITAPAVTKVYVLVNSSNSTTTIFTTSGSSIGLTIASGVAQVIYSDGVSFYLANPAITATYSPSKAVATNASGKLVASTTTATELGYVSGATSNIQTQINAVSALSKFAPVNYVLSI